MGKDILLLLLLAEEDRKGLLPLPLPLLPAISVADVEQGACTMFGAPRTIEVTIGVTLLDG